jgi:hypothetical protein
LVDSVENIINRPAFDHLRSCDGSRWEREFESHLHGGRPGANADIILDLLKIYEDANEVNGSFTSGPFEVFEQKSKLYAI